MTIIELINRRIEETGVNADDVCRGICTPSMFSKVKKGEKKFKPETLAMILERLGMHNIFDSDLIMAKDYYYVQIIRQTNQTILNGDTEKAAKLLESIEEDYDTFSLSTKQRFDMSETLLIEKTVGLTAQEKLNCFEKIIRYTIKDYNPLELPSLLTITEILILNVVAICYHYVGDTETAISILYHLVEYIETMFLDKVEAAHRGGIICANLSIFLNIKEMYNESIHIAEKGIEWAKTINSVDEATSSCMYSCASSLLKRGLEGDFERSEQLASDAYHSSKIFNRYPKRTKKYRDFFVDNFNHEP